MYVGVDYGIDIEMASLQGYTLERPEPLPYYTALSSIPFLTSLLRIVSTILHGNHIKKRKVHAMLLLCKRSKPGWCIV